MKKWNPKGYGFDTDFYRKKDWLKLRKHYIEANPVCELCDQWEIVSEGAVVDHIIPRRLAPHLELEPTNLQTLCGKCHRQKTGLERTIDSLERYLNEMKDGRLRFVCVK
ncbi:HNH endonuclease [Cyclobacterium plantarum]|uniref:HNH endonuclease n=1 Tax=Cyclobacterium plantarum TaxID=2716263 RepID=A0ABX0HCP1_9BACT|nr:HNH endonuclease signature motif containing protein [Cyclobacterium plantarum]NHE57946.1 HNH endonuclease [Cyclobacterium plantarum]